MALVIMNLSWDTLAETVEFAIRFKRPVDAAREIHQNKALSLLAQYVRTTV